MRRDAAVFICGALFGLGCGLLVGRKRGMRSHYDFSGGVRGKYHGLTKVPDRGNIA